MSLPTISLPKPSIPRTAPQYAPHLAEMFWDMYAAGILSLDAYALIAEIISLGQVDGVLAAVNHYVSLTGIPQKMAELNTMNIEVGLKIPLQQRMNQIFQANIPDVATLGNLRSRGFMTWNAYNWYMEMHGYPSWASQVIADAAAKYPSLSEILELIRRGLIAPEYQDSWLKGAGYHENVLTGLKALKWQLPGYQDLISIYMREGYLEEKWVEIPGEFIRYMEQLGYNPVWAKQLWGKHWVLPGVNLLYDMFHKKIIDYDTMALMLRYHDFEPAWRDRLIANAYAMIPRVDLRRSYRYGFLGAGDLQERYEWLGFKPSDAVIMAAIAERESLDIHYSRLRSVAAAAFRRGKLDENAFIQILSDMHTPEKAISLILEAEKIARATSITEPGEEPRTLTVSQVLAVFTAGLITREFAAEQLEARGYSSADLDLLLQLAQPRPEAAEVNRELISAACAKYREGLMDPEQFLGYLRRAGLGSEAAEARKEAEDLRFELDYSKDLMAMFKEGYRKDVYTLEEYLNSLITLGMQPDRAQATIALEQLRKLPKPKAAG